MTISFRQFAVSGSAAVALLGGAAAITLADSDTASAAETQTVAHRAVTAPVTLPDGRTMRITGMGGHGHTASADQVATVAAYKTGTGTDSGFAPQGVVGQQVPAGYNQQVTTQAGGGAISITVAVGIGLLIGVGVMVRRGHVKFVQAAACVALGVYLAPTFVGPLIQQIGGSVGSGLGNVWSGF